MLLLNGGSYTHCSSQAWHPFSQLRCWQVREVTGLSPYLLLFWLVHHNPCWLQCPDKAGVLLLLHTTRGSSQWESVPTPALQAQHCEPFGVTFGKNRSGG